MKSHTKIKGKELIRTASHHSKSWLMQFFPNLRDAAIRWSDDDASSLAASVAYYLALSLFPMMLLLTSGIGLLLQFTNVGRNAETKILSTIEMQTSPVVKIQVEQVLEQLRNHSIVTGPFGLGAAILAAIGVFAQIDRGFDRIFRIPAKKDADLKKTMFRVLRHRLFAFVMLVCVGAAILTVFAGNTLVSQLRSVTGNSVPSMNHAFRVFDFLFEFLTNSLLFGLVYRWLPKKPVVWADAFRGGMLASAVWEIGRTVLGMFLIGMRYTTAYGAIGSFIAILLWCYYGISILFFGAEYVQVLERKRSLANSLPKSAASAIVKAEGNPGPDRTSNRYHDELPEYGTARPTTKTMDTLSPCRCTNEVGRTLAVQESLPARVQPRRSTSHL